MKEYVFDTLILASRYAARERGTRNVICEVEVVAGKYIVAGNSRLGRFDDPRDAVESYRKHVLAQSGTARR